MGVDNYKTIQKISVEKVINRAMEIDFMTSNPIEHYTIEEICKMAELAKKNDLVLTVSKETSNFYQGVLISLIKRSSLKDKDCFIDRL